ncbi:Transmembrane protein [Parasponia andersonii]|uniref:Transmembrane protein n=1 Tax=Parasponia andersonii TaxID=3476 RepID=A0A2P5BZG7_PARAD|nr:Transmembrane protein [Parasponia andersonii]
METSTPVEPLSLFKVLSDSKRVITSQPGLFRALSFLFILPLSIADVVYPILIQSLLPGTVSKGFLNPSGFGPQQGEDDKVNPFLIKTLLLALAYAVFTLVFSNFAVISITYSVIHGFSGQPVKLKSAIKSIATSFFPLLGTTLLIQTIILPIAILLGVVFALLINGARLLGFRVEFSLPYFLLFCVVVLVPLLLIVILVQVNWALFSVVVVAESTWGLKSLKRSASLIKGRRRLALSLFLYFFFCSGVFTWIINSHLPVTNLNGGSASDREWKYFSLVTRILVNSAFQTLVVLYELIANAVLYVYCTKASADHGDKEYAGEYYISLPVDDNNDKAPRVVSVACSKLEV